MMKLEYLQYDGHATACNSMKTPVTMIYNKNLKILKLSFSIQRVKANGFLIDTAVQAKANLLKVDWAE